MLCRRVVVMGALAVVLGCGFSSRVARADEKTEAVKVKEITLTVPASWKQEEPNEMQKRFRLTQFKLDPVDGDKEGAELVVFYFQGGGGGVDPNLTRWVGQFAGAGRTSKTTVGECPQGKYYVSDLTGTYNKPDGPPIAGKTKPVPGTRSIGVILQPAGKDPYYLKLTGSEKTVTAAAAAFRKSFGGDAEKEEPYEVK